VFISGQLTAQKITYSAENKKVVDILEDIEDEYDLHFSYSTKLMKDKKTSISAKTMPVDAFLYELLHPFGIIHKNTRKNFYVLKSINKTGYTLEANVNFGNTPLPYANIAIVGTYEGTITDANGNFTLKIEDPKATTLKISYLGYETKYINAEDLYKYGEKNIRLSPQEIELEVVDIKEYINSSIAIDNYNQLIKLSPRKMQVLPGLSESDILKTIQFLPGVGSISESSTHINFRGSTYDGTIVNLEDIPFFKTTHYFGMQTTIIPTGIEEVDIYRNAIPVEFGNSTSGLVNLYSINEVPKVFKSNIGLNMNNFDLQFESPILKNKCGVLVNFRRSITDIFNSPSFNAYNIKLFNQTIPSNANNANAIELPVIYGKYSDSFLKFIYNLNNINKITFSTFYSLDRMEVENEYDSPEDQLDVNSASFGSGIKWQRTVPKKSQILFFANYSYLNTIVAASNFKDEAEQLEGNSTNYIQNIESKIKFKYLIGNRNQLSFGAKFSYTLSEFNKERIFNNWKQIFMHSVEGWSSSIFAEDIISITDKFQVIPGMRATYYQIANTCKIHPLLKARYEIIKDLEIKASAGTYSKQLRSIEFHNPELIELIEPNYILAGNDIPILTNSQITAGIWYTYKGWMIDIDYFRKDQNGILISGFNNDNYSQINILDGSVSSHGFDLMFRKRFRHYRTWASYTYSNSTCTMEELSQKDILSFQDRPHQLKWTHSIHLGQYEFSLGYTFKSGIPISTPIGIAETESELHVLVWDEINQERLPFYTRLDASIWFKFPRKKYEKWNGVAGISIMNLYNRKNVWYRKFNIEENEYGDLEIVAYDRYLIGINPNVSVRVNF